MRHLRFHRQSKGFTIVELMIATSVFSVVLLVVAAGVISFTRQYYKGLTSNTTQNVTRNAMNEISQAAQFTGSSVTAMTSADGTGANGSGTRGYCINKKPYYYVLGKKLDTVTGTDTALHVLVASDADVACPAAVPPTLNLAGMTFAAIQLDPVLKTLVVQPRELVSKNMRLAQFSIVPSGDLQKISLKVVNGDGDLLCNTNHAGTCDDIAMVPADYTSPTLAPGLICRSGAGSQFCAASSLSISIQKRL